MDTNWQRSSFCANSGCVEVRRLGVDVFVRDDSGEVLRYTDKEWADFIASVKAGEFDL